jgi:hypothetical protein
MLKDKIQADTKEAMRARDELKLSVLRMLSSAMKNKELEKRAKSGKEEILTDEEVTATIRSEAKKRKDAVEGFEKGGRKDLAGKETAELKILETYLPAEMPDEELEKIIAGVLFDLGMHKPFDTTQGRDFGRVVGEVMKQVKGQANGDRVSTAVKRILG